MSIWEVFGKVGGITHVLALFSIPFTLYALLNFRIDAIHSVFEVETKYYTILESDSSKVTISAFEKIRLLIGCCANKKL